MSGARFTAGPWRVVDECAIEAQRPGKPYTFRLAECNGYEGERIANARLIASAPALLEALEVAAWWLDMPEGDDHDAPTEVGLHAQQQHVIDAIRAALRAAGGSDAR